MKGTLTPFSVAFYIVPLINAMIRFGSPDEKERMFRAFLDNNEMVPCLKRGAKGTFEKIGIESARECVNAKSHQDTTKKKVSEELEQRIFKNNLLENQVLFIRLDDDDNFPSELNGLIANQLANKYHKPTIVARLGPDGMIKGSARGLNQSKLSSFKDFLNESNLFEYAVGHDNAMGIAIPNHSLDKFHEIANKKLKDYNLGENSYKVNFIRQANADDISDIIFDLEKYKKVWGQNNPTPLIVIENIRLSKNDIQIIGKNLDTIKFIKNGICYMKFFAKDFIEEIDGLGDIKLDIVGETNVNEWGSFTTPQIFINDYDLSNGAFLF
jgi:single-stranded-DNA-specific exonuclease